MKLEKTTLLRYGAPGVIVALVLGFSLIIPATADDNNNNGGQCGYGYGQQGNENEQGDNDEQGENEQGDNEGCEADNDNETEQADNESATGAAHEKSDQKTHTTTSATVKNHTESGDSKDSGDENAGGD